MEMELQANRSPEITRDPHEYVGVYYNIVGTVHIDVTFDGEKLRIAFQGLPDEVWEPGTPFECGFLQSSWKGLRNPEFPNGLCNTSL
jgi:hypothetical protein